jgi:hypothetical protein
MLTRIRIEAEGPTTQAVQEDIFAAYDAILGALYWPDVVPSCNLTDEVYEQTGSPHPDVPRWYKGRAIVRFTNTDDSPLAVAAEQVRGRTEHLQACEQREAEKEARFAGPTFEAARASGGQPSP